VFFAFVEVSPYPAGKAASEKRQSGSHHHRFDDVLPPVLDADEFFHCLDHIGLEMVAWKIVHSPHLEHRRFLLEVGFEIDLSTAEKFSHLQAVDGVALDRHQSGVGIVALGEKRRDAARDRLLAEEEDVAGLESH